jgi:hypothetical protein
MSVRKAVNLRLSVAINEFFQKDAACILGVQLPVDRARTRWEWADYVIPGIPRDAPAINEFFRKNTPRSLGV